MQQSHSDPDQDQELFDELVWPLQVLSLRQRIEQTEALLLLQMSPEAAQYAALLHHANEAEGRALSRIERESAHLVKSLSATDYQDACRYLRTLD